MLVLWLSAILTKVNGDVPVSPPGRMVKVPITIRNVAGHQIGVWWLEPGQNNRRLIPQTTKPVRNSSSVELQSYQGHEFVVRPLTENVIISQEIYHKENMEAIVEVGRSHDVVIIDEHMQVIRHDASWALHKTLARAMASPFATTKQLIKQVNELLQTFLQEWLREEELRLGMTEDLMKLGGDQPSAPIPPAGGFPSRDSKEIYGLVEKAVKDCSPSESLPQDPGWYDSDSPSVNELLKIWGNHFEMKKNNDKNECVQEFKENDNSFGKKIVKNIVSLLNIFPVTESQENTTTTSISEVAYMIASQHDSHDWCGRWARLGECQTNPNYMNAKCSLHCQLHTYQGKPIYGDEIKNFLEQAEKRDQISKCIVDTLSALATKLRTSAHAERIAKAQFTEDLRNRTCAQVLPRSGGTGPDASDVATDTFIDADNRKIPIFPLFRSSPALPAANITYLPNFATAEECAHAISRGQPHLRTATVQGDDDPSTVSIKRRAKAAQIGIGPDSNDGFAKLWRRSVDAANYIAGYNLDPYGQEPFSLIYYNGTRLNTSNGISEPDQYLSHCDGACDGSPHLHGGRVATVLIYCNTPQLGGATTFTRARTVAAPNPTDAVFFSYLDKNSDFMDTGISTHSACPVLDGDKYTLVMWLRKGISKEDPWQNYEPSGTRHPTAVSPSSRKER